MIDSVSLHWLDMEWVGTLGGCGDGPDLVIIVLIAMKRNETVSHSNRCSSVHLVLSLPRRPCSSRSLQ